LYRYTRDYRREYRGDKLIIPRNPRSELKVLPEREDRLVGNQYRIAQGTLKQAIVEASRFTATCSRLPPITLEEMENVRLTLKGRESQSPFQPLSWEVVLQSKKGDKSPGEPWLFKHAVYEDVLKEYPIEDLATIFQRIEEDLESGVLTPCEFSFYVQSKLDGYAAKKFEQQRFRTVQGADMFTFFFMKRWFGSTVKKFYETPDWCHVKWDLRKLSETQVKHSKGRLSAGWDVSGMDRNITNDDINNTVDVLSYCSSFHVPQFALTFAKEYNAYGPLVFADGTIHSRGGGNPSGTFLTTIINCLTHYRWMKCLEKDVFGFEVGLLFSICGDDNLHSVLPGTKLLDGTPVEDFDEVSRQVQEYLSAEFCTSISYEPVLTDGKPSWAPPGIPAPFLDYAQARRNGFLFPIPRAPYRRCRKVANTSSADVDDDAATCEVLMGVKGANAPFYAMKAVNPKEVFPLPVQKLDILIDRYRNRYPNSPAWTQDFTPVQAFINVCGTKAGG